MRNELILVIALLLLLPLAGPAQDSAASDQVARAEELRNKRQFTAAISLLRSYVAEHPDDANAQFLLGETLYWVGDWSGAKRHFTRALRLDPVQAEARRQLEEIRQVSAPWISLTASHRRDDQPLRQGAATIEGGVFLTPLQRLVFRGEPQRFGSTDHGNIFSGDVAWLAYWPSLKLDTELAAGYLGRHGTGASDWIGRAAIGLRLPQGITLRARSERAAYLWTISSLETPVMSDSIQGIFAWNRNGWLAEASYGVERFPDANKIWNAYGWLLAPLLRKRGVTLQAGYSIAYTDSDESRWNLNPPPGRGEGRYDPYYTPEELRVHNVIFSGALPMTRSLTFRANGGYGFSARELAPPSQLGQAPAYRNFHPWNARASLEVALPRAVSLMFSAEHEKTAFWQMNRFSAGLTYRFSPKPLPDQFDD